MALAHGAIPSMGFNSYGRLVFVGNMVQNATLTAAILAYGDPRHAQRPPCTHRLYISIYLFCSVYCNVINLIHRFPKHA